MFVELPIEIMLRQIPQYCRPEDEWFLFPDQPIIDRCKRKEPPWFSYVVLPRRN